jgi:hypothetical protein
METMHAAGRRRLPPVPRAGGFEGTPEQSRRTTDDAVTERMTLDPEPEPKPAPAERDAAQETRPAAAPNRRTPADQERPARGEQDAAQQFVARLRAAADDFAKAAGAVSAVVREAVPPARHRRARCRLVLRLADGIQSEVLLLGSAGEPGSPSRHGFDRQIRRWLSAGQVRDDSWLVADPDGPDGVAVDVSAWLAAS